ncbi:uncharacterized protein DFL_009511 [Arthrobotrys flagrans]|uniref:Uncharacterized protein n=1 Tax=Arthrobotrys flagrans TaxID=97331 RepID=A0A436ZRX8_ARTFL|nr:hypothetical protein DFL_009511 [Arthrobotrys flagrans]
MHSSRSILNAFFVLAVALALVPVAQASIYAMADGVNFNALARQKAQKRAQQDSYREIVRNPFRLFKRQEADPGTPISTPTDLGTISNTTTATSAETTPSDISSSITTLEPTSTDDGNGNPTTSTLIPTTAPSSSTPTPTSTEDEVTSESSTEVESSTITSSPPPNLPTSTDAENTPSETETTTADAQPTTTEDITSAAEETSTTSPDEPSETSTEETTSTEVATSTEETTTIRTTLDTTVKSAFTTAWSTSTFTLPDGAVGTVTEYLVVVPTLPPTEAQNPQDTETATGTASLHTSAATLYAPGPAAPVVALMAVLGYVGGAAF